MASNQPISIALQQLAPGAEWSVSNGDLSTLVWLSPNIPQPTNDQINAAIAAYVPPAPALSLQDQLAALQAQVNALLAAQGK